MNRPLPQFWPWILAICLLGSPGQSVAKTQFDVFAGFDGVIRAGQYYPISFEIKNENPSFEGVVHVSTRNTAGQTIEYKVDLPKDTRKRFVIPAFAGSAQFNQIDASLRDRTGKTYEEFAVNPPIALHWEGVLLGAMPSQFSGMPIFPAIADPNRGPLRMKVVRIASDFFPDNPILLESLNALYLSSDRALGLKEPEIESLQSWLYNGGHLIVNVDQAGDLNTATWLRDLLPARVDGLTNRRMAGELHRWISPPTGNSGPSDNAMHWGFESPRNRLSASTPESGYSDLASHLSFDREEMSMLGLTPSGDATVLVRAGLGPALVSAPRGRGLVTLFAFSVEKEPFKSWKNRPYFWAKLAGVPPSFLKLDESNLPYASRGLDAAFGAMIDTRQVRKLPRLALLSLLAVYLLVIGPLDQWWLKKINRPMLTWITFPAYVALFSLLIYSIGFRLRAGNTEWSELHVVDVLPKTAGAEFRGRTYTSLYSPANASYKLVNGLAHSILRPEFHGSWMGGASDAKSHVQMSQLPGLSAEVDVPVWTSQLNVMDWQEPTGTPVNLSVSHKGVITRVEIENLLNQAFDRVWLIQSNLVFDLGAVGLGSKKVFTVDDSNGTPLESRVRQHLSAIETAMTGRGQVMGGNEGLHIDDWANTSVAVSFPSLLQPSDPGMAHQGLAYSLGTDLMPSLQRGDSIILAWTDTSAPVPAANRFQAQRGRRACLFRMVVPRLQTIAKAASAR